MKIIPIIAVLGTVFSFQTAVKNVQRLNLKEAINGSIDVFNAGLADEEKQETNFKRVSKSYQVFDVYGDYIGETVVFDENSGYLFVDKDYNVKKESFDSGIDDYIFRAKTNVLFYQQSNFYLTKEEALSSVCEIYGSISSVDDMFFGHRDSNFTSQKTRNILQELDSWYPTLTDTSLATYYGKQTWSTYQSGNDCGPLAIANLLWTYKINGIVDLTNNATSSADLAQQLQSYVSYNSSLGTMIWNVTGSSSFFGNSGYYIDYTNVANGIASTLTSAPIVGFYYAGNVAHYALVTGKGRSIYKHIFGINLYTSWDIVNCWENVSYYRPDKYWVDNQYIYFGYVLRNSNGDTVAL